MTSGPVVDRLRDTARLVGGPVWRRLRPRIEAIAREQIAPVAHDAGRRNDELAHELTALRDTVRDDLMGRVEALDHRLGEVGAAVDWLGNEQRRMAPQLAALESRLAELEHRAGRAIPSMDADPPELGSGLDSGLDSVLSLVEEIRMEHARVRARLGLVARYEERIARLEDAAAG
ncbi:hypothetical protein [Actinokineospora iranica]|uniref:Uncharacterized protein n=1 Tax=Actinokineospora iranica TaxID=1271860 RepID=A0A1G6P7K4_9PSEU|nr:hypothetical protein [Actinokineospora iranica]SDC75978.1 hypothetical protein SAMN05216174_104151 [Actinokineospora iranica]